MADPVLLPGTVPEGTEVPNTSQKLINFVAAYMRLTGLSGLQGVVISSTEPVASDRDKIWCKIDSGSNRAIGLYRYLGGWNQLPAVPLSGEAEPANPRPGELFYNTNEDSIKSFIDGQWTTELWHRGSTSDRPDSAPIGYLYYDTTIQRLLRYTSQGWSTVDGCIGQLMMLSGVSVDTALERNPGWVVYTALGGRVPMGYDGNEYTIGEEGGRESFDWSANGNAAQGGSREQGLIHTLSIDGDAFAAAAGPAGSSGSGTVSILPPFHVVLFMRKEF